MKIRINIKLAIYYIVILFAVLNGPLRLSENGMSSLYRLLAPIVCLIVIVQCYKKYEKDLLFIGGIIAYSCLVSVIFYHYIEWQEVVIVIYIFFLYALAKYIKLKDLKFNDNFLSFLNGIWITTILLAWLQYFTHYSVPFIDNATVRKGAVNVYFSNENELGSAIACIALINIFYYFYQDYYKHSIARKCITLFGIVSSYVIIYLNDAKLSLLGLLVGTFIIFLYKIRKHKTTKTKIGDKSYIAMLSVGLIVFVLSLYFINPSITTRDYDISIREMLFDNILAILKGKEIAGAGTYHDRSQAIIYGLKELQGTFLFGIGLGNSWTMLAMPQYVLLYAKSMHNIIFQFLAELGLIAILIYGYLIRNIVRMFKRVTKSPLALLKASFCIAFVFISSQSSSGILSNYLTIISVIYIALINENTININKSINKENKFETKK